MSTIRKEQLKKLVRTHLEVYYREKMKDPKYKDQLQLDGKRVEEQIEESIKFYEELSEPFVDFCLTLVAQALPTPEAGVPHLHKIV